MIAYRYTKIKRNPKHSVPRIVLLSFPLEEITHTDKWHDRSERLCGIYLMIARRELRTLEEGGSVNAVVIESIQFTPLHWRRPRKKKFAFVAELMCMKESWFVF